MANRGGAAERTSAWARPHSCARACSRSRAPSTAAPSAWAGTTKPGGTGSPAAVMAARLAPFPPASRTSVQRSSSNQTTSLIENRHRPHGSRGRPDPLDREDGQLESVRRKLVEVHEVLEVPVVLVVHDEVSLPELLPLEHRPHRRVEGDRVDAHHAHSL